MAHHLMTVLLEQHAEAVTEETVVVDEDDAAAFTRHWLFTGVQVDLWEADVLY